MNIGVIGVGHIGGTLAEKFVKAGHQVSVANSRGKEAVRAFAEKIGAAPSDISEIVKGKDVVILAVPLPAIEKIPRIFSRMQERRSWWIRPIIIRTSVIPISRNWTKEKQKASGFLGKSGIPSSKRSTTFWGIPWQRRAERKGTREDLPPLLQETVRKTKPSSCA